jgi:hypothetical protein
VIQLSPSFHRVKKKKKGLEERRKKKVLTNLFGVCGTGKEAPVVIYKITTQRKEKSNFSRLFDEGFSSSF